MEEKIKQRLESMNSKEQEDLKSMWKVFGMETTLGKKFYNMYNKKSKNNTKIKYPKLKKKRKNINKENIQTNKKCPQKTKIYYPPLSYKTEKKKFHKIDMIPKRKNKKEIQIDMKNNYKREKPSDLKEGNDREKMINDLQEKFSFKNKNLEHIKLTAEEENKLNYGLKLKLQAFQKKYEPYKKRIEKEKKNLDKLEELNILFDDIMREIEEKQIYLKKIENFDCNEIKKKTQNEIYESLQELKKITSLITELKNN